PPFDTGADFSFSATIPDNPDTEENETTTFTKQPSIIEQKAYRDTWGRGLDSYLQWFYETAVLLRELLSEDGSIYVHLDWHIGHYVKTLMDEVFGYSNFLNEVVWAYFAFKRKTAKKFPMKHDVIMSWTKTDNYVWNTQFKPHSKEYLKRWKKDESGRYYRDDVNPTKGGTRIIYLDELEGDIIDSVWDDIPPVNPVAVERTNYSTQKPEKLIERIIKASSNEGDLVLDCFCGSGTTPAVAEKLNRRWIACDLGRFAIHTTRKRLLGIPGVRPFVVQNLGKYERQQWLGAEFQSAENKASVEQQYRHFILQLYHAVPLNGYTWLHGVKAGRLVHVSSVEAPVTITDIKNMVQEFWKIVGKESQLISNGIDVLGWDFAFEINETAAQFAAANKVDLKFKKIPREVLEKKAVEQGDIKFFELASLSVDVKIEKRTVSIALSDFIVPPDDVPEDVRTAITHWSQWIDYWAVDWNYQNDTFHNEWQSYRTRKDPKIELKTKHEYDKPGKYQVVIKVIDILGNDTTKMVEVEVS
ncbi:MAG: site-specific DNA-methyltransferase, partial [candidate division KSB1 bacterium]|nr:site-specific DNA-methyltransferase [candidate division KSB1 bacterium]